jgi:ribosomal protein S18 acetylase RimI-like enzyme
VGTVRRAAIGDEQTLRVLRLQAMVDAPEQFGSTYEREAARTTADWQRWFGPGATFIFENSSGPVGLAAGMWAVDEPTLVYLMAVWVHPAARGTGAGEALVEAVLSWSASAGATTVRLEVVEGNGPAIALYERQGFIPTGEMITRERDGVTEIRMERPVP